MIKRIVAWKFKDEAFGVTKAENLLRAKAAIERCGSPEPPSTTRR